MQALHLTLASVPFNAIASGKKTIESRLYNDKFQRLNIGDEIMFTNRENESQTLTVRVIGLLRYMSFNDLFTHNDPAKFDGPDVAWLLNQIHEFYSESNELINGVIGIEFILM